MVRKVICLFTIAVTTQFCPAASVWALQDGVYDLRQGGGASVLDQRISSFSIANASPAEASEAIGRLPEFRRWLADNGVTRRDLETGKMSLAGVSGPKVSLSVSNVTLRTILNQLARQLPSKQWSAARYGDRSQYLAIWF